MLFLERTRIETLHIREKALSAALRSEYDKVDTSNKVGCRWLPRLDPRLAALQDEA